MQTASSPSDRSSAKTSEPPAIAPPIPDLVLVTLDISGMKCAGCVRAVETELKQCPGVVDATVNLVTEMAIVECATNTPQQLLADRLSAAGFPSRVRPQPGTVDEGSEDEPTSRDRSLLTLAIATLLLIFSCIGHIEPLGLPHLPGLSSIGFHWGLATLALLGPGRSILIDGWQGLRRNRPTMNSLVGLGTVTAYSTSVIAWVLPSLGWECFFDEPVMLVSFIILGRTLEQRARNHAARAFRALLSLRPTVARLVLGVTDPERSLSATYREIPAEQVQVGQWIHVLPGDKIPVDGTILYGQTTVNESMLTGEAMPVPKGPGDGVVAGSLNQSGAIALQTTRTGSDTTLAQMIALVETAQTRKAPIQQLADTVAGYFTYGIMAIAGCTFLFWYGWGTRIWPTVLDTPVGMVHHAMAMNSMAMDGMASGMAMDSLPAHVTISPLLLSLKLAIAVLVIACPCALGLATPTALLVGSGVGAEQGLLLRGGDVLEKVHRLTTVVFDKTGTLTTGHPQITDCLSFDPQRSPEQLLQLAATIEQHTRHPLAEAIVRQAERLQLPLLSASDIQTVPGYGVVAQISEQTVHLGTADWLTQCQVAIAPDHLQQSRDLQNQGKTIVHAAIDQQLVGLLALTDTLRSDAASTLHQLQDLGLQVMLMTGDQRNAALAIAQSLTLPDSAVLASVRPDEKSKAIAQLQAQGQRVAMVGDGINDAPALAQADVGIALHSGTGVAIETADIVLMGDRLQDVVRAIRLSQATFRKIQQNLTWAMVYNLVGIPVAMGVLLPQFGLILSPATAGAFMALSSITVVLNSLLLYRHHKPSPAPLEAIAQSPSQPSSQSLHQS